MEYIWLPAPGALGNDFYYGVRVRRRRVGGGGGLLGLIDFTTYI